MSNLTPNQTKAKSWFIVTNGLKGLDYTSMVYFLEVSLIYVYEQQFFNESSLDRQRYDIIVM